MRSKVYEALVTNGYYKCLMQPLSSDRSSYNTKTLNEKYIFYDSRKGSSKALEYLKHYVYVGHIPLTLKEIVGCETRALYLTYSCSYIFASRISLVLYKYKRNIISDLLRNIKNFIEGSATPCIK